LRTYWWEVPNRDNIWKQNEINMLGSYKKFLEVYELAFLLK
jgi:hypothetical protein